MFHYFHGGDKHPPAQGTISSVQFEQVIDRFLSDGRLLAAEEWARGAERGTLRGGEVCVSFDDALRSQFDIALPVLRRMKMTAFWFVQSGVLTGEEGSLEAFRHFRNAYFSSISEFYRCFYERAEVICAADTVRRLHAAPPDGYLREFAFYTSDDRRFRYVRDDVLRPEEYLGVMEDLIRSKQTSVRELSKGLSLDADCLRTLEKEGHVVGLHSHSHPTNLAAFSRDKQREEYAKNLEILSAILDKPPSTMAHPCNSYSADTLEILRSLGIRIGFRSNMAKQGGSALEYPRKDSADLLNEVSA